IKQLPSRERERAGIFHRPLRSRFYDISRQLWNVFTSTPAAQKPLGRRFAACGKLAERAFQVRLELTEPIADVSGLPNLREAFAVVVEKPPAQPLSGPAAEGAGRTGDPPHVFRKSADGGERHNGR